MAPPYNARFPDTVAASLDVSSQTLACVYNDHSLYVWDVQDVRRIGKFRSSLFHSAGIWDIEVGEHMNFYFQFSFKTSHTRLQMEMKIMNLTCFVLQTYSQPVDGQQPALPDNSFITCASDDTIRIWNCDSHMATDTGYTHNVYSSVRVLPAYHILDGLRFIA